jgi:selenocysteine-specific elongation factor
VAKDESVSKHVIIGTAGHIDHGKSALIEALTGTNPDRLEEEKRRGITIDLGFAFLQLDDVRMGFVDVPGHERFVHNMLAGAGGIDLVMLVVAANEGIMPQTREHFDICQMLGISRGIVAITKIDLVEQDATDLVKLEAEEFVRGSFLERAPIIGVCSKTGAGIEEIKAALLRVALGVPGKDASRHVRLPIDRAFVMKGFGTVVTGTLISGTLRVEQEVELLPGGKRLRIRGLHSGGHAVEQANAGQRTAVNLADIETGEIERGMVLAAPGVFRPTNKIDVRLSLLASARPLKTGARVHFHQGTTDTIAAISLLNQAQLTPGSTAFAQVQLGEPVVVLPGDRFVIRQFSPVVTIGGGTVLDAQAVRHKKRDVSVSTFLETIERGNREETLAALAAQDARGAVLGKLIARTGWLETEIRETAKKLIATKQVRIVCDHPLILTSRDRMEDVLRAIEAGIEQFHTKNPLLPGIAKEQLRGGVAGKIGPEMFRAALDELVGRGKITISGDIVQRAKREIALTPEEAKAKEQIAREFEGAGLAAPAVAEVLKRVHMDAARSRKLLQMLIREKTLVKITEELLLHRTALENLHRLLTGYKEQRGPKLPIPAFKELAGITRKYAIPLLEFLDREGLTRRAGDERVIL